MRRIWGPILIVLLLMIGLSASAPDRRVISSVSVSDIIKAGKPAEFDDCIVIGDLNLNGLRIEVPVHFNNTVFQNSVKSNSVTYNGDAYFLNSTYNGDATFWRSIYNADAYFGDSTYNGDAYFGDSTYNGTANFGGSTYNDYAYFWFSTYNGTADFGGSTYNGEADFRHSTYNGDATFWRSIYNADAYFWYSIYKGDASFWLSTYNSTAYFEGSAYNGNANFGGATFNKDVYLNDVVLKGNLSFNNSQFKSDALLENTTIDGKLALTRTRYDKLYIRWHNIKGGLVYDDAAYMSLMKNFKDLGYFEDYEGCYFQFRKEHRGQPWYLAGGVDEPIRKGIDFFLEEFYGYGTKPLNAVYFSILIIVVFGIVWRAIGLGGPDDITGAESKVWEKPDSIWDLFAFSTTVFLSGTRLFIDPPDIPKIKGRSRSIIKRAFTIERILGALFSILFFLAISGTMMR